MNENKKSMWSLTRNVRPQTSYPVLCQLYDKIGCPVFMVLSYNLKNGTWRNDNTQKSYARDRVVAWMPLPEPYKELRG